MIRNIEDVYVTPERIAMRNIVRKFRDHYKIVKKIGCGAYGTVYLAEDLKTSDNSKRAVKIIKKEEIVKNNLSENNVEMLLTLDHPNIVKIYDILEDDKYVYLVQEYCEGGDLFEFIIKNKLVNERMTKIIIKQLLGALAYLHNEEVNIVHRDIKPENILILRKEHSSPEDITVKLSDFGSASFFSKNKSMTQVTGTPFYIAPEVILGKYDQKCDIWSTGVLTYTMLAGKPPYSGRDYDVLFKILHKNYEFPDFISYSAQEYISNLMNKNPVDRHDVHQAFNDVWLNDTMDNSYNQIVGVEIISNLAKFSIGKNLRRSVLSYIYSRKYYDENNYSLNKLFKEIDLNNDGKIDINELFQKYGKYFPGTVEEEWEEIKKFVNNLDINKSGKIEYSEFLTVSSVINKEVSKKHLQDAFDFFDYDKNGFIEANDMREIFEDTDLTDEALQQIIDEYDKNGDRKISFSEFCDVITNNY